MDAIGLNNPALDNKSNPLAESFRFFNVVGGKKYCSSGMVEIRDKLSDLTGTGYINTGGRLIQEKNPRTVDDAGGNC